MDRSLSFIADIYEKISDKSAPPIQRVLYILKMILITGIATLLIGLLTGNYFLEVWAFLFTTVSVFIASMLTAYKFMGSNPLKNLLLISTAMGFTFFISTIVILWITEKLLTWTEIIKQAAFVGIFIFIMSIFTALLRAFLVNTSYGFWKKK